MDETYIKVAVWSTKRLIAGIETMHMIKKGQLHCPKG